MHQIAHDQITNHPGWCEHDPKQIINSVIQCISTVMDRNQGKKLVSIGITNQRETIVPVNKSTQEPLQNAIVWHDTRTEEIVSRFKKDKFDNQDFYQQTECGLPINTYFSAVKIKWLLENVEQVKTQYANDNIQFCTIDAWILVNLTNKFYTDVTNASRTMLVDINTLNYSQKMLEVFDIKQSSLVEIKPCCFDFGTLDTVKLDLSDNLSQTKVTALIGDQQSATLGQLCVNKGDAKCTYGTGAFLLVNTGLEPIFSKNGLLTTPCFKLGENEPV